MIHTWNRISHIQLKRSQIHVHTGRRPTVHCHEETSDRIVCKSAGAIVVAHELSCRWDLPEPGIKPVSPALSGRLLTNGPPGKPPSFLFKKHTSEKAALGLACSCWHDSIDLVKQEPALNSNQLSCFILM